MFNVGGPEVLVILLVALVILGPEQLPKAMRTFGNVMNEIRKVSGGFQDEMRRAMDQIDPRTVIAETNEPKPKPKPGGTAATMDEADVTEVVARNEAVPPVAGPSTGEADGTAAPTDPDAPAPIDPADRAAG